MDILLWLDSQTSSEVNTVKKYQRHFLEHEI